MVLRDRGLWSNCILEVRDQALDQIILATLVGLESAHVLAQRNDFSLGLTLLVLKDELLLEKTVFVEQHRRILLMRKR